MSETKVKDGNLEDALKRFKRQCARNGVYKKFVKENTMKSQCKKKKEIRGCKKKKVLI